MKSTVAIRTIRVIRLSKHYNFIRGTLWLIFIVSIALATFTYWKAEIFFKGHDNDAYTKFYFIALAGVTLSLISFFLRRTIQQNIILTLISTVVVLYVAEFGLNYTNWSRPDPRAIVANKQLKNVKILNN